MANWEVGAVKAVADPSSGEILRVEQRGDAPLPSPSLKLPTGECWKIVQSDDDEFPIDHRKEILC